MNIIKYLFAGLFALSFLTAEAQQPVSFQDDRALFEQGKTLYQARKYAAAREILSHYLKQTGEDYTEDRVEAEYLRAMSAMRLDNKDASRLLDEFVDKYPEKSRAKRVYFQLAVNQFDNYEYTDALKNFEKADMSILKTKEVEEYYFKYGYSLFRMRKPDEAQMAFSEIKDLNGEYSSQAKYYFSHIAYEKGNYQTALDGFTDLKEDETYGNLVTYYIVQIYYHQDRPQALLEEALPLLETINDKRKPELSQLIGEAYYRLSDYEKAIEYLTFYQENTRKRVSRENIYQLAFTQFQNGQYEPAIKKFQQAIDSKSDSLAQNAYYHLGMSYIETGQYQFAANAFNSAYKIELNRSLREDALYNYVKLSYEHPFNPYNKAIDAVKRYMEEFPDSRHLDEINSFLVDIFLSSQDYASAIAAYKEIQQKTDRLKTAFQKISFYRGVELYQEENYFDAVKHFKEAVSHNYDNAVKARALFWIGNAYYQYEDYDLAYDYFSEFLVTSGAYALEIYPAAYYNQGYIFFSQKKYDQAKDAFRKYVVGNRFRKDDMKSDAYIRLGDCYFVGKDYNQAINYYERAIERDAKDQDYAQYQKALALGGLGQYNDKILELDELLQTQATSAFRDDATFEMAQTYVLQNKEREALKRFKDVYTNYPYSEHAKKAYLKSGLLYYNQDENEKALNLLKDVAEKYPGTPDAREALASIKNIYIDMNRVDDYFNYAESLGYASVSASEQDSAMYVSAENLYMDGDCDKSKQAFTDYLDRFPDGGFAIHAHFYRGQCYFREEAYDEALENYEYVLSQGDNEFTETALAKASGLVYDNGNYGKALDYFSELSEIAGNDEHKVLAFKGMMRCHYELEDYQNTIKSAENLLKQEDIKKALSNEAHLLVARSALEINNDKLAEEEFNNIAGAEDKRIAAEANYYLALLDYRAGQYDQAENRIFEISEKYAGQNDWLAKSFVLLADVYVKTGNLFQAKQTLQSIIDNYDGKDLVEEARQKKDQIISMEEKAKEDKIKQEKEAEKDEQDVENY
ncbi:MAG: tetratricopeptide repeat protein [Bacteroidota bacterium]